MLKRGLIILLLTLGFNISLPILAADKVFKEGEQYSLLSSRLPEGIAPVVEFFYYGCETCYKISPLVSEWVKKNNVRFALIPTHSETAMVDGARFHHTFQLMGVLNQMYMQTYEMIQAPSDLQGEARINFYLDKNKVDKAIFWKTWNSEQVQQRLKGSAALSKQAQVFKTPTFIVHGLYKVDIERLTEIDELFELLDFLLAKKPSPAPSLLQKSSK